MNAGHEDIRLWLTRCQDYFDQNKLQWREEGNRIKYGLGKMQGATVTPFAMAYRNQMTGELGYTKQEGYDQWKIFKEQVIRRFGPTHEEVKALRELYQIKYKGDINEFLQQIESKNNRAKVTGIAFRKIVEDEVPEEAIRRSMSMQQKYIDDREWLEALRKAVKDEEDLQERRKLKGNSFSTVAQKRKAPEQATAVAKKPKYTAKEKRVYQAAKKAA